MYQEMLEFIQSQRVGVFAVEMPDGSPHAAALHFAHTKDPLTFILLTNRKYRKSEALLQKEAVRGSLVIGFNENNMKTLQLDGEVKLTEDENSKHVYFDTFPEKRENFNGPDDILMVFTPTWWRYTDWTTPKGKAVLTSEDQTVGRE